MEKLIGLAGRFAGIAGIVICVIAAAARVIGVFSVAGLWVGTLLQAGIAATVIGCFLVLLEQSKRPRT